MRPVNLIPADSRRGDRSPMRTGAASYVIVAALGLGLLFVIALALTSKQISDRNDEIAQLTQKEQEVTAREQSLQAFADFRAVQESRAATVSSLAESRFDWKRVMDEFARVVPPDVWLIELSGTVNPAVNLQDAPAITIRDSVPGPALELVGCAPSQDAVAGLVADLEDIDGVTRVGVQSSTLSEDTTAQASTGVAVEAGADSTVEDCRTRDFIARFEIVVAFDAVPTPDTATTAPSVPAPLTPSGADDQLASAQTTSGN